jgi:hypothetical protein
MISKIHHQIQVKLFRLDIDDTQVGLKVYKTDALRLVMPTLRERGFSLDLEIFVSLRAHNCTKFVEMPVTILRTGGSTVSLKLVFQTFQDMTRIFWRSRIALQYDAVAYSQTNKQIELT